MGEAALRAEFACSSLRPLMNKEINRDLC